MQKKINSGLFLQIAEITHINEEREILGRQKIVRWPNVPVLTSHAGMNPRSKSGYEHEVRVINCKKQKNKERK